MGAWHGAIVLRSWYSSWMVPGEGELSPSLNSVRLTFSRRRFEEKMVGGDPGGRGGGEVVPALRVMGRACYGGKERR